MSAPTIKAPEVDEPDRLGEFCGICRRQISRYTCPSCNLFYCSLNCFRSERHSRCSEAFYRKEIEMGIKTGPSKSEDDRNKMLELLRQIEDESTPDEDLFHSSGEEDENNDLARRFSLIDISAASSNDLLRLLNKKEKDKFFASLKNPSSALAQELLHSAEMEKTRRLPWWEACNNGGQSPPPYGVLPDLMAVPADLVNQASHSNSLLYNICVVLLAYAYVTRHLCMSPLGSTTNDSEDQREARKIILQSVPFLKDRRSKLLHVSLTDAVVSFWSQLDPGGVNKRSMLVLLEDVGILVRPRKIIAIEHCLSGDEKAGALARDHPCSTIIMVISDICSLFNIHPDSSAVTFRRSHILMKLTFYAAHILSTPSSRLHALADEVHLLSKNMCREEHE